jgi:hypothetical protein
MSRLLMYFLFSTPFYRAIRVCIERQVLIGASGSRGSLLELVPPNFLHLGHQAASASKMSAMVQVSWDAPSHCCFLSRRNIQSSLSARMYKCIIKLALTYSVLAMRARVL